MVKEIGPEVDTRENLLERLGWKASIRVEKRWGDWTDEQVAAGEHLGSVYETIEADGNALLNAGIQRLEDLLIGAGGQAFDATHCRIGVGNGTTAVTAADTDLSAAAGSTNRWFQLVSGAPSRSGQTLTFTATFATGDGNFAWNEWGIDAGTASGNTVTAPMLNRKVVSLGTKTSAASWAFTVTIVIS